MDRSINGEMADKQNPLDYGVQIRFIDDLKEESKPQKTRSRTPKANSYGVAVRVQGIDGQPFVVLNSGEKRESSYGVQIRTENPYRETASNNPPVSNLNLESYDRVPKASKTTGSISSDSDLPENPYAVSRGPQLYSQTGSQYSSTSDEEQGSKYYKNTQRLTSFPSSTGNRSTSWNPISSPTEFQSRSSKDTSVEELRRSRSQDSVLSPEVGDPYGESHYSERSATVNAFQSMPAARSVGGSESMDQTKNKRTDSREERNTISGLRPMVKQQSVSSEIPKPPKPKAYSSLSSQVGLGNSESIDIDTKPLSSVDSLINKFDVKGQPRGRPTGRRSRITLDDRKRSQSLDRLDHIPQRDMSDFRELQRRDDFRVQNGSQSRTSTAYNTNSLNRPQRRGSKEVEVNKSVLTREWLNQSVDEPVLERQQQNKVQAELQLKSTPDLLRDQQAGGSEHTKELIYSILRDGTTESESSLKRKTSLVFEKIKAFTASPDGTQFLLSQKNELQRKVGELQRQLDEETKQRVKLEVSRDRPRANMQNMEIQLEEKTEECNRLKDVFERKKNELNGTSQELLEVRMEKEQVESRMRDLEDRLMDMQEQSARVRASPGSTAEKEALLKELMDTREELEEVLLLRQKQDELVRQRERELTALKGALKEEVANHDKEMDRVRQQYQKDMEQLRKNMEDVSKDQLSLESERQKINSVVRSLQREVDESSEEINHWKDMFLKNKDELRSTKQELMQVKLEKEEFEDELREVRQRYATMQAEVDHFKNVAVGADEADAVKQELQQMQDQLRQLSLDKQRQEELLHQRERELGALKGALKDEVANHDQALDQLRQQFQKDLKQFKRDFEETSMDKAAIESEREAADQMRKVIESTLRETQEENDDMRRRILNLEAQLKEYKTYCEEHQGTEQRLKEKIGKLEAERKLMEDSLGEATDQEQEMAILKRTLESRLEEAQRNVNKLSLEYQELRETYQEEMKQKDQLKRMKCDLEEQKRLLDKTIEKLNKELDHMADESRSSLSGLQAQLEEYKEKSRKEISESQKQAKERTAEAERVQFNVGRLQEEVQRLKQALHESQTEKETAELDKELITQRLQTLSHEMDSKKRSQEERLRQAKGLEDKVKRLEVELDEEKNTVELLTDRINRSRDQMDQLRAELMQERSGRQDLECDKISLERQNKELKNRLANSEGLQKPNASVSQLESRIQELQERLQAEEREKNTLLSSNRKLERKVKEFTIQLDDERLHVNDQKDQLNLRVKTLKRQVDEAEEEIERLEGLRKKALRDLEEQHEINEQLQTRVKTLEKDTWRKNVRSTADSSLHDDDLSSDGEFDSAYDPSSIKSLLTESNLQTSSC
ncbi:cingulin isoform X2 [Ambystoma mexicanum]|uniref:cingulin isoform X2 n=1 Tax=Ambystoma mexicanum TaxID=8296 RepID=UPI0037E95978